jgi:hypothetical protein
MALNPRYTGRQVWNRQRKDEVLLDVHDVALGHTTKMRWNERGQWIFSDGITHPPVIDAQTFARAQEVLAGRRLSTGPRERIRRRHVYALGGRFVCGLCGRKMQAHWANDMAYYRCRFSAEYALASKISHPSNVLVRERDVLPALDAWLARQFAPHRLATTIDDLTATQPDHGGQQATGQARQVIRDCDAKMARYKAALDAGADIEEVTAWINAGKADRIQAEAALRRAATTPRRMTREQITAIVEHVASLAAVIRDADPADKADIYRGLNLALTYQPGKRTVHAELPMAYDPYWVKVGVRGGTDPVSPHCSICYGADVDFQQPDGLYAL